MRADSNPDTEASKISPAPFPWPFLRVWYEKTAPLQRSRARREQPAKHIEASSSLTCGFPFVFAKLFPRRKKPGRKPAPNSQKRPQKPPSFECTAATAFETTSTPDTKDALHPLEPGTFFSIFGQNLRLIYNERTPNDPSCKGARLSLPFIKAFPQVIKAITEKVPLFQTKRFEPPPLPRAPFGRSPLPPCRPNATFGQISRKKVPGKQKRRLGKQAGAEGKQRPNTEAEAKSQKHSTGDIGHKSTGSGDRPSKSTPTPAATKSWRAQRPASP